MTQPSNQKHTDSQIKKKIHQTFKVYIEHVIKYLKENDSVRKIKHLDIHSNSKDKIEHLENGEEFSNLIDDSMKIDSPFVKSQFLGGSEGEWGYATKNFFRRSHCYADILSNNVIDQEKLFEQFLESFKNKQTQISYYALIEFVYFPKKILDFDSFKICSLSKSELDEIFSNPINEMFYPYAKIDSGTLQNYWFACVTKNKVFEKESLDTDSKVRFKHSAFTKEIELVMKKLALYDWQCFGQDSKFWMSPEIPYVFSVNDNLLSSPLPNVFDYRQLSTDSVFDPYTGEELGQSPIIIFHLDEEFERFICKIENTFKILKNNINLNFIDNALGHFIKAFFANGIEELLWHISAIEALLGSKSSGLTSSLARRSALLIEKKPENRIKIYKAFKKLYDFRSNLVHGNPDIVNEKNHPNFEHLYNAHNISRQVMLWFLEYVSHNIKKFENLSSEKVRDKICEIIDLEPEKII